MRAAANVALLAEGVDRNSIDQAAIIRMTTSPSSRRAWIEIKTAIFPLKNGLESPSSRRAWIEIASAWSAAQAARVALLAEGVDRNTFCSQNRTAENGSPSSRRAWIEIQRQGQRHPARHVALLAEGVDRNFWTILTRRSCSSRPPRGGRG